MPRRKEPFSQRGKKELREEFEMLLDTLHMAHKSLRVKLQEKGSLRDQEFRTLEHIPSMISKVDNLIKELKDVELTPLNMDENIHKFLDMFEKEIELLGPNPQLLREKIFVDADYYRCKEVCGELHKVGEECPLVRYSKDNKLAKSTEELEDNIEDTDSLSDPLDDE